MVGASAPAQTSAGSVALESPEDRIQNKKLPT